MSPIKSIAAGSSHAATVAVAPKASAQRRRHKGNSHTELSQAELEQMLLGTAFLRAQAARSRSRA